MATLTAHHLDEAPFPTHQERERSLVSWSGLFGHLTVDVYMAFSVVAFSVVRIGSRTGMTASRRSRPVRLVRQRPEPLVPTTGAWRPSTYRRLAYCRCPSWPSGKCRSQVGAATAADRAQSRVQHGGEDPAVVVRAADLVLGRGCTPYWRAMCMRSSASASWISSPLTSTVTLWMLPVNLNGLA